MYFTITNPLPAEKVKGSHVFCLIGPSTLDNDKNHVKFIVIFTTI
jgi:hypothetical protein